MNDRLLQIGFSQRIRLEWLERTANLVLAGNDEAAISTDLQKALKDKLSVGGTAKRGNREKAISILMKIWVRPPYGLSSFQHDGLRLLSHLPLEYHLPIHWGMTMAVYPFWAAVAVQVGRLLNLQGKVVASQVQRRLRENYGDRQTVSRAARRILRSFVDWDVLNETSSSGIYAQGMPKSIDDIELIAWLSEAFLHTQPDGPRDIGVVLNSTAFFPFRMTHVSVDHLVSVSNRLELFRLAMDQCSIMVKREKLRE